MHFGVSLVDEIHNTLIDFGYLWGQMNVQSRETTALCYKRTSVFKMADVKTFNDVETTTSKQQIHNCHKP